MLFLIYIVISTILIVLCIKHAEKEKSPQITDAKNIRSEQKEKDIFDNNIVLIDKAIINGEELCIKYRSHKITGETEITVRNIIPIKICSGKELNLIQPLENCEWYENEKYLYAFCKLRNEERHFRVDRILSIEIINDNSDKSDKENVNHLKNSLNTD